MHEVGRATRAGCRSAGRVVGLALAAALALGACHDGGSSDASEDDPRPTSDVNPGPVQTLAGGLTLPATPTAALLGGENLAYGQPLPSEDAAGKAFKADPEVRDALARRVYAARTGEHIGDVVLLRLRGSEIFDEGVLDAFVKGLVAAAGDTEAVPTKVGAVDTFTAIGAERSAAGYRIGDLVALVTAPDAAHAQLIADRALAAVAAKKPGSNAPSTPLRPAKPITGAFVSVPSVTFVAFPPPEKEDPPAPPPVPAATGVEGRYGVVAGERRTTAWAYALDPKAYPSAEALAPKLQAVVSAIAGGTAPKTTEVVDRVVYAANPDPDAPPPDPDDPNAVEPLVARAFVEGNLAIVVTGRHADEVDAAISDWISHL